MSVDQAADIWVILDGLERVEIWRPGTSEPLGVVEALRAQCRQAEGAISAGDYLAADILWYVPALDAAEIRPGDQVHSGDNRRWTVLKVEPLARGQRLRLWCRDLVVAWRLDRYVHIEVGQPVKQPDGSTTIRWTVWRSGVRARVQPWQTVFGRSAGRKSIERRYVVYLDEAPPMDRPVRLRSPRGRVLEVISVRHAERIDSLPWVEAIESD